MNEGIAMSTTLEGKFASRTQADLAVERLVQEIGSSGRISSFQPKAAKIAPAA